MRKLIKKYLAKQFYFLKWVMRYFKSISFSKPEQKQIIVCFDGVFPHGGLVDRLKGIVSFYQVAKTLDYDFKILFYNPFALDQFLEPNQVDWLVKPEAIKWHPFKDQFVHVVNDFNVNPIELIKQKKANRYFVYANIDYGRTLFPHLNEDELAHRWHTDFKLLFKISDLLNQRLQDIDTSNFIAFHTRFTSIMGDFKDTTSLVLSEGEQKQLKHKLLENIKTLSANKTAYIFSDSINFINYVTENSSIKAVEGLPFHMDNFEKNTQIEGHLKTMIDFFMIAKSSQVYFLKTEAMYNSSFSKYAAIVGEAPFTYVDL
ncbi:MAG: hypothetical protein JXK08_03265 [Flavobacteriaceae bacterium]|nr:hypothetical protein [Flavobacteriaceae bacterium]